MKVTPISLGGFRATWKHAWVLWSANHAKIRLVGYAPGHTWTRCMAKLSAFRATVQAGQSNSASGKPCPQRVRMGLYKISGHPQMECLATRLRCVVIASVQLQRITELKREPWSLKEYVRTSPRRRRCFDESTVARSRRMYSVTAFIVHESISV